MKVSHFNMDYTIKINGYENEVERLRDGEIFGPIPIMESSGKYHEKDAYVRFGKSRCSIEITNYDFNIKELSTLHFLINDEPLRTAEREDRLIQTRYGADNKLGIIIVNSPGKG
jgi:hypothetical protein